MKTDTLRYPTVKIQRLSNGAGIPLPNYMTTGAAGADVCSAVDTPLIIAPGKSALIPTGFAMQVADGFEIQIRPRSGLALRNAVTVLNTPATIDSDYTGPVGIILINHGTEPFIVERGERIAQLIVAPVVRASFAECMTLTETERGTGGFGSTSRRDE